MKKERKMLLSRSDYHRVSMLFLATLLTGVTGSGWGKPSVSAATTEHLKSFTVADSIAMTHFVDPAEDNKGVHPQFSPDGKHFLIVTERGLLASNVREYALLIYNADNLKAKPVVATVFSTSSNRDGISGTHWLNNDIVTLIGENPGEMPQVYAVNWRTKQTRKLTSAPDGTIGNYSVTPDLSMVMYSTSSPGDVNEARYKEQHGFAVSNEELDELITGEWKKPQDLWQMFIRNIVSGKTVLVKGGDFSCPPWLLGVWLSPNGQYAIARQPAFPVPHRWEEYEDRVLHKDVQDSLSMQSRHDSTVVAEAMLVNTATGDITPLLDAPTNVSSNVSWSSNSHLVFLNNVYLPINQHLSPEELAKRKHAAVLVEVSIPSRSFQRIADMPNDQFWTLNAATISDSITIHAVSYNTARDTFEAKPDILFLRHGNTWTRQLGQTSLASLHPDITITQSLNQWPKLVLIDPRTHHQSIIIDPNPQFRSFRLGHSQIIHWTGKFGEPLVGGLVYPVNYRPGVRYPLVIQTHGFDPDTFLLDGSFTSAMAAQELANKGIFVLQFGDTPLNEAAEGTSRDGPVNISPFESVIDYLAGKGLIDRNRVGLNGFSITGFHVFYAITFSKYHFAAATSVEGNHYGYWDYVAWNMPFWQNQSERELGSVPWENWKPWMDHSISFNYDKIHTPLRLESDRNPGEVLGEWETFAALRKLKKPVDLIFVSDGDHPNVKPWDRMASQQGNVDWFVFWLKGQEDPVPEKRAQYARWRMFRKLQARETATNS